MSERAIGEPLDRRPEDAQQQHGHCEVDEEDHREDGRLIDRPVLTEDIGEHVHRRERADHEDIAVREVDELDDAVDHRVADGDEGVDRADRQAVDELGGTDDEVIDDRDREDEQIRPEPKSLERVDERGLRFRNRGGGHTAPCPSRVRPRYDKAGAP